MQGAVCEQRGGGGGEVAKFLVLKKINHEDRHF